MQKDNDLKIAVFANGCFWCSEAIFKMIRGVYSVVPGYSGGDTDNPTYEDVSSGNTGHAEAIKIEYDPNEVSYEDLLVVFFNSHNPTTLNQQGNDIGTQYRSVIFYSSDEEKNVAQNMIKDLNENNAYEGRIVTEVVPLHKFFEAEDYHHDYYQYNFDKPYCNLVIAPKLEKIRERFKSLIKDNERG